MHGKRHAYEQLDTARILSVATAFVLNGLFFDVVTAPGRTIAHVPRR